MGPTGRVKSFNSITSAPSPYALMGFSGSAIRSSISGRWLSEY